jgi:16S rRNA (uracil1498-N3)-methyltransferase
MRIFVRQEPVSGSFELDRNFKKRLIKVLRLSVGESLEVFSPGKRFLCKIDAVLPQGVRLLITNELTAPQIPVLRLVLGQALIKSEHFEYVIQKGTELGIAEIFPLVTERSIVKPVNVDSKVQRWNEIAEHAAGQSGNSYPALVHAPEPLSQFVRRNPEALKLFLHERQGGIGLSEALSRCDKNNIMFIVGPEGGWSVDETEEIVGAGFLRVHLGPRILRAETAGLVLSAILQYQLGDLAG